MSDCGPELVANIAKEINACAVAWFERRRFWDWSEVEQTEFDAWLSQSLAHRAAYVRIEALWNGADRIAALRATHEPARARQDKKKFVPGLRRVLFGGSMLVLAAAVGIGTWLYLSTPRKQMFATPIGSHETITLNDGSQIELNTDTVLQASIGAGRREIWLDKGEAYFQIVHDPTRPFVVVAGNDRLTDLGTKFVVRREPDRLRVAVVEGRVRLDASSGASRQRSISLAQGDVVVATADAAPLAKESATEMTDELEWRNGTLVFDNIRLADAAAELNRYNAVQIVVADTAAARTIIGGKFPANDISAFTELVQHVLGLRVVNNGREIVISR
jgi:transmembrane sensor